MKSKLKKRASIIIFLGIFFAISSIYYSNPCLKATYKDKSADYSGDITLDRENMKISAISGKIHIDNNWTAAKAAGICTGEGTYSEPYVIEDLEIDGGGLGSCILIENSDVYFKIENCTLYNSGGSPNAGIHLYNVDNGKLIDNNCSSNYSGIMLSNFSDNNTISGNSADHNGCGIFIAGGYSNTVSGNSASYNNYSGIYLLGGTYTNISGNIVSYNNQNGLTFFAFSNDYNNITENIFKENSLYGVSIGDGDDNNIYLNCFSGNGINAYDGGSNNRWDNGTMGNYWSNYTGLDVDGDGIGDVPYNIKGSAGSQDRFPLMKCPISTPQDGGGIPIELIVVISVISGGAVIGVAALIIIRKRKRIE